jgi:hypothetical protein
MLAVAGEDRKRAKLRHLRLFLAVTEHGSKARASEVGPV